jgi:hypothetical protein
MPITKERLHTIVTAGLDLERQYLTLCNVIGYEITEFSLGRKSADDTLTAIALLVNSPEPQIAPQSRALALENMRWKLTHHKNDYDRERKRRERRPDLLILRQRKTFEERIAEPTEPGRNTSIDAEVEAELQRQAQQRAIMQAQLARTRSPHRAEYDEDTAQITCECGLRVAYAEWTAHFDATYVAEVEVVVTEGLVKKPGF